MNDHPTDTEVAEIVNGAYGTDTVAANYVKFWFRRFHSGIFDVEGTPRTDRPVDENVDKITEIIEVDRHVSSRSIAQKLKIDQKTVVSHLRKELLPHGQKLNLDLYCQQLDRLKLAINQKWPELANRRGVVLPPFSCIANFLSDKKLGSREDCENRLLDFFTNKDQDLYEKGIMMKHFN
ncbi:histonelysine Nmethyltransferase SETMARlike [Trichonephila clavipes]|nr:histonelysine Nmethyltransferase SETMARlike [Trichonephila clavipes]